MATKRCNIRSNPTVTYCLDVELAMRRRTIVTLRFEFLRVTVNTYESPLCYSEFEVILSIRYRAEYFFTTVLINLPALNPLSSVCIVSKLRGR